jgi:thiamine-monophosphate kinase
MNEFDIIKHYFAIQNKQRNDVVVGIGDDAAIVNIPQGYQLAVTTDTLIAGVHFPMTTSPYDIGHKSLAVNLSDLAAMGAAPAWVTMALSLADDNPEWLRSFCEGFFTLANRYQVQLIGGDLTHGTLSITVQAMGLIPPHKALLRSQAKPGDLIYVTGTIGDAGLALRFLQNRIHLDKQYQHSVLDKLNRPEPRIVVGEYLRGIASAAIDISDGLAADLGHILEQSRMGAILYVDRLPLSEAVSHSLPHEETIALALTAGDDYELCFTVPAKHRLELEKQLAQIACRFTCIGEIRREPGLELINQNGSKYHGPTTGYQHF